MTAPRFVDCACGHTKMQHDALAPQCSAGGCECLRYRPGSAANLTVANPQPEQPTVVLPLAQVLNAARKSHSKRTVNAGAKIEALVNELRVVLAEESKTAAVRAEVEQLEAALAAAKAKLRGTTAAASSSTRPNTVTYGEFDCPDCDQQFTTAQGRGAHRSRIHGYRRDGAA